MDDNAWSASTSSSIDTNLTFYGILLNIVVCSILGSSYPKSLYGIIYIFSLSLCCFSLMYWAIWMYPDVFSDGILSFIKKLFIWYTHVSTGWKEEFALLGVTAFVVLVPQFLSYIISGIFGAASSPNFVRLVTDFFLLSIAKFYAVYAGLATAILLLNHVLHIDINDRPESVEIFSGPVFICAGALTMIYFHMLNDPIIQEKVNFARNYAFPFNVLGYVHRFMRRNVREEKEDEVR